MDNQFVVEQLAFLRKTVKMHQDLLDKDMSRIMHVVNYLNRVKQSNGIMLRQILQRHGGQPYMLRFMQECDIITRHKPIEGYYYFELGDAYDDINTHEFAVRMFREWYRQQFK
jgi:hypothetical protein